MSDKLDQLSIEQKRQLLLQALKAKGEKAEKPEKAEESHPISLLQEGLLFAARLQPDSTQYNMPYRVRLQGQVDVAVLERSINEIVRRHAALRSVFVTGQDGQPKQVFKPFVKCPLTTVDLRNLPMEQREAAALAQVEEMRMHLFDLASGPLYRIELITLQDDEHWLMMVTHHIIFDGTSLSVFLHELGVLYDAFAAGKASPLPELKHSYAHFARWQRKVWESGGMTPMIDYWKRQLGGSLPVLELPTDRPRPAVATGSGTVYKFTVSNTVTEALRKLSRQEGTTLFITLLSAFQTLLYRYTHQADVLVGTPVSSRNRSEVESLMGLLINTIVLRSDLSGAPTFRELLKRVHRTSLDAYAHQDVPFPKVVEAVQPDRSHGRHPIFQAMFALMQGFGEADEAQGLTFKVDEFHQDTAKFDLDLGMGEGPDGLSALLEYNTDVFNEETIAKMAEHFVSLLTAVAENADQPITTLPMLSAEEREQLLVRWNQTDVEYSFDKLVHERVEEQAARTPDAVAVVARNGQLTYAELNAKANQVAHFLRKQGVKPNVPVGVCTDRSLQMVVAQLAVLKAGGAYVPMDPGNPDERLHFIIADTGVPVVLTQSHLVKRLPTSGVRVLPLDADVAELAQESTDNLAHEVNASHMAYLIFTSGSTGQPKGVMVTHGNMLNFLFWYLDEYRLQEQDRCTQLAGVGFDVSVMDIWPTLMAGASLYLPDDETRMSPSRLQEWILQNGITVSYMPTPLGEAVLALPWPTNTALRLLMVGGDKLHHHPAEELPFVLINHYGPTETTVWSTVSRVTVQKDQTRVPSIGRPIANTSVYVLDEHLQPVPVGVTGQLFIGGKGVTLGYWQRPELTAEKFIADPFNPKTGARIYATGDRVRFLPDGNLEFLGRIDHQVKIRGLRIELGEIEAILDQHPQVKETVAITREKTPGDVRLVAYLLADSAVEPNVSELREYLKKKLPEYMVPAAFVTLAEFPLTPNGKVDRKALPEPPQLQAATTVYAPPSNTLEKDIAAIWQQVLGLPQVGLDDNFFELGGHSLKLVEVHEQLRKSPETDLPLLELFQYPTIRLLATRLGRKQENMATTGTTTAQLAEERHDAEEDAIAVIGMANRAPGAGNVEEFWHNLKNGVESIRWFTRDELLAAGHEAEVIDHPHYVKARGVVDGTDLFDAAFFGVTPRDAEMMDPQHRVFLETAWTALEHAAYDPERYPGRIGIFGGAGISSYMLLNLMANPGFLNMVGINNVVFNNDKDFLVTRTAYKLNLTGPAVNVQTACSTSLVAVHMACESLLQGDCEMALAGGVTLRAPLVQGYMYREGEILSPVGQCRAFDEQSQGTVDGAGCGVVVLKRLSAALRDGDTIHAVIKGSAINNDGSLKVGFTAPSIEGQSEVISQAMKRAGVPAASITYVEAHGTGTVLGDPIEFAGLTKAYRAHNATENGYCAIGSVKTNIGHLDTAAGVTGLIKTVLSLKHKQLPPSLHYEKPNPKIDFANSPFYVNTQLQDWKADKGPRRAGVSSFGIGGTNAHVILEEAPYRETLVNAGTRPWQLLTLSAKTESALEQMTSNLLSHLRQGESEKNLADIAYTLQMGRKAFKHRRIVAVRDLEDATTVLESRNAERLLDGQAVGQPNVVFMFTGQGSQYVNMARGIYESEPVFREQVDRCADVLKPHLGLDIRDILFPTPEQAEAATAQLNETWLTQPALFVIEYALATWWMSIGVQPQAMIGHSIGEYAAACLAGVFTLEDALALVAARGRLIQDCPTGSMMAVSLAETDLLPLLGDDVSVAAINSQHSTVVSGPDAALTALRERLEAQGIQCRPLHTSHAFHSEMMQPALAPFAALLGQIQLNAPQVPFISNVTGTWITPEQATDPTYWVTHLRQAVRFADGLMELYADPNRTLLEVGPGHTLATLARQHPARGEERIVLHSVRHPRQQEADLAVLLTTVGRLWLAGVAVNWELFSTHETRKRIVLPTYPFERKRFWVEPTINLLSGTSVSASVEAAAAVAEVEAAPEDESIEATPEFENEIEEVIALAWREVLGVKKIKKQDNFFELGGDSLMASRVVHRLRDLLPVEVPMTALFEAATFGALSQKVEAMLVELLSAMEEEA